MKNVLRLVSLLTVLYGCNTTASKYLGRPDVNLGIASGCIDNVSISYVNGVATENINHITISEEEQIKAMNYMQDIEVRLYVCLKYPRRCK